jgi:uncharacterized protein YoxC
MNIYNTQPLLNEIEIVIKNGLDKMLSKYLERYDLLERTHKQIMQLPSIKEAIGKDYEQDVESDTESYSETKNPEINNIVSCQTEMKYNVLNIESKLDKLEKKYAGLYPMLDKILDKIETLNNDVQKMKSIPTNATTTVAATSTSVEPTIVSACQNENIKFEIKEDDTESVEVEEDDESLEDDTESLEDEDDVNPALITCATVKITKEALEVVPNDKVEIVKVVKLEPEIIPVSESVEEELEEEDIEEEDIEEEELEEELEDSKSVETETKSDTESVEDEEVIEEEKSKEVDAEDVEEELEVITIDDVDYCTNNEENGFIWELTEDGEQGAKVGYLKDGEPFFYAEEN